MGERILVINPNSTEAVTRGISEALEPLRLAGGPAIECVTLEQGPPGIETQVHADSVVQPLARLIQARDNDADAFVIACFSDPGLHLARAVTRKPVIGIAEAGLLTALTLGERVGVLAILPASVPRHLRYVRMMGLAGRFTTSLPIGLGVVELADDARVMGRMTETGERLRDAHGTDVVVMGCAGMARFRGPLQQALGIPVVEPSQAAVTMALGRARLRWSA